MQRRLCIAQRTVCRGDENVKFVCSMDTAETVVKQLTLDSVHAKYGWDILGESFLSEALNGTSV